MALTDSEIGKARAELNDIARVIRQQAARLDAVANVLANPVASVPLPTPPSGYTGRSVVDPKVWKLAAEEDFNTPAAEGQFLNVYGKTWSAYETGWPDTNGKNAGTGSGYNRDNISVADGCLRVKVGHGPNGKPQAAVPYLLAPGSTKIWDRTYGRHEVRVKCDPVPGYKIAFLTWPASDDWAEGEIDWPEGSLNSTASAYSHYVGDPRSQDAFERAGAKLSDWHTYGVEWTPGRVVFLLDGKVIGTSTKKVPDTPHHWVLQVETNLGGVQPKKGDTGYVYVDWVSVWSPA